MAGTYLTEEELKRRAKEVWPDDNLGEAGVCGEGIVSIDRDGTTAVIRVWHIGGLPQCRVRFRTIKKGMKRRAQALAYLLGERDDFSD